jgi:hypothetical protein
VRRRGSSSPHGPRSADALHSHSPGRYVHVAPS